MSKSGVEWSHVPGYTGETWNILAGCKDVSPGCLNCYAKRVSHSFETGENPKMQDYFWGTTHTPSKWTGKVNLLSDRLSQPASWKTPRSVFVCSLSDLFNESVPDDFIDQAIGQMALAEKHLFMVLTKRIERAAAYWQDLATRWDALFSASGVSLFAPTPFPPKNIWFGTSIENNKVLSERLEPLISIDCRVRFLSIEPLLEPLTLAPYAAMLKHVRWVIVGGESGANARPFRVEWAEQIQHFCHSQMIPFFMKQLGDLSLYKSGRIFAGKRGHDVDKFPASIQIREFPI
jgi:protein gp37